ncbi:MAG: hypothetical protein WC606_00970 [Candidatus Absconditabacterales bacterium]
MKKLNIEEKLYMLAYAGINTLGKLFHDNADLPDDIKIRTACIYKLSKIVLDMERYNEFPEGEIQESFSLEEMSKFFNSLVSSDKDNPKDIKLLTALIQGFLKFTESGMERYADFVPFISFKHDAWLELISRIQKSDTVDSNLKKIVDSFVKEGFTLILHPDLIEFSDPITFFPWFEKLQYDRKEKLISDAMRTWKEYEARKESYCLSGDDGEKWYKEALEFAVRITSKEYVSKVFAEAFKEAYPEIYEKFKGLADLHDYEIPIVFTNKQLEKKKKNENGMREFFEGAKYKPKELAKILSKDTRVEELSQLIFALSGNISDRRYAYTIRTLEFLIEKYQGCELVKKLSSLFTKNIEDKIENDTLEYIDIPPNVLYINNKELEWLF